MLFPKSSPGETQHFADHRSGKGLQSCLFPISGPYKLEREVKVEEQYLLTLHIKPITKFKETNLMNLERDHNNKI